MGSALLLGGLHAARRVAMIRRLRVLAATRREKKEKKSFLGLAKAELRPGREFELQRDLRRGFSKRCDDGQQTM
jgi:hypothetical protein